MFSEILIKQKTICFFFKNNKSYKPNRSQKKDLKHELIIIYSFFYKILYKSFI